MSGCLDKLHCNCGWLDPAIDWLRQKRNMLASIISGTLFAVGWWCVIDASAESSEPLYAAFYVCGIFSTIALLMINAVSTGQVTGDMYTDGCFGKKEEALRGFWVLGKYGLGNLQTKRGRGNKLYQFCKCNVPDEVALARNLAKHNISVPQYIEALRETSMPWQVQEGVRQSSRKQKAYDQSQ